MLKITVRTLAELDDVADVVHSAVREGGLWRVTYSPRLQGRPCVARQHSDQYRCDRCGLSWDMTDPEPPRCRKNHELLRELRKELER